MNKTELISQTKMAFDFIQKLYFEVSYLIKEVEGLLSEEKEEFVFGRSGGYAITTRSSNGLEPYYVNLWSIKKLAVFFVPKSYTELKQGQTITRFEGSPKILHLRIVLEDKGINEPTLYYGIIKDFLKKAERWPEKIEQLMAHMEYNETKVFTGEDIDYEDNYVAFKGIIHHINLFDLNNSQEVAEKLVTPALKLFREN